jgi:hypothetical protein
LVGDSVCFLRRRRTAARDDGGFGGLRCARILREKARQGHQSMRLREGRRREGSRGERRASLRRNRRRLAAEGSDSGDEIQQPGGSKSRRGRKEKERRAWGSYRRGLDGHLLMRK